MRLLIITAKNIDRVFDRPRYIVIPRASIFQTFLLHTIILNVACVLMYGVWMYAGIPMLLVELLLQIFLLRRIWLKVGYSVKVFAVLLVFNIIINLLVAIPERQLIADLIIIWFRA